MNEQKIYEMIEQTRRELHERIDRQIDDFQVRLQHGEPIIRPDFELPLSMMPAYFKGRKPIAIRLRDICGKVHGRDRLLLSDSGEGMDAPINFCPGMYFEGKFDTETLLKVITNRVFAPIGYDYSGIRLRVYDPALRMAAAKQAEEPEADIAEDEGEGFVMQMM